MTQENQGTTIAVPNNNLPVKRKRGRPRKDRSQGPPQAQGQVLITPSPAQAQVPVTPIPAQAQVPVTPIPAQAQAPITRTTAQLQVPVAPNPTPGPVHITPITPQVQVPIPPPSQGQASIPPFTITEVKNHQSRKLDIVPETKNDMVGQAVFGILDGSFEAGYLLTVKVGNTDTVLKGVVFQPGSSVPVSVSNDVAPHIRMLKRADVHMPHNPPTTVYQAPPIVAPQLSPLTPIATPQLSQVPPVVMPQPSLVPPIVATQPSQVPPIVATQPSQVPPIITNQPFQVPPVATPEPTQVAPIAMPQTFQSQPLNNIGGSQHIVQPSSQSNDLLPAHPQPELKNDATVIQPMLPEISQAPAKSEAPGGEGDVPTTHSSVNNNMDIDVASPQTAGEAVTVPPLDSQKGMSEGQGEIHISSEAASTHGE